MRSHQDIILNKLSQYLRWQFKQNFQEKQTPIEFEQIVDRLKDGHCFGFSLVHAVMDSMNRLIWWEYILEVLEKSDEITFDDLLKQKLSTHPDFTRVSSPLVEAIWESTQHQESPMGGYLFDFDLVKEAEELNEITFNQIFERALNFIVYNHTADTQFVPIKLTQLNILTPHSKYFDFQNAQGKKFVIQDRKIPVVGHVNAELLDAAFNESTFTSDPKLFCLVHSAHHTIRVGFRDNKWFIYDPNFIRNDFLTSDFKYLRYFANKKSFLEKIIQIQGQDIAIEIATSSSTPINTPHVDLHHEENNISVDLLLLLTQYRPKKLKKLIMEATDENSSLKAQQLRDRLIKTIKDQNKEETGLQILAKCAPYALTLILKSNPETHAELQASVIDALSIKNAKGETGLHTLAKFAPNELKKIILSMEKDTILAYSLQQGLAYALIEKEKNNKTILYTLDDFAPSAFAQLVTTLNKLADNNMLADILSKNFVLALRKMGWHLITTQQTLKLMDLLIKLMSQDEKHMYNVAKMLLDKTEDKDNSIELHALIKNSPQAFIKLIEFISLKNWAIASTFNKNPDSIHQNSIYFENLKNKLAKALLTKNNDGVTSLQMINQHHPDIAGPIRDILPLLNIDPDTGLFINNQPSGFKFGFINQFNTEAKEAKNDAAFSESKNSNFSNHG